MYTGDIYEENRVYYIPDRRGNKGSPGENCRAEKVEYFFCGGADRTDVAARAY